MSTSTVIELPIYWTQHFKTKKDKTTLVGMNWYRNAHFHAQNAMKKEFHSLVANQVTPTPITGKFKLKMGIYYKNPTCDGANIAALIEKFTLDALQDCGIILNDNINYHVGSSWEIIDQDIIYPRCLVTLINLGGQSVIDEKTINSLEPTDPQMVKIRTHYFDLTGHYGSEKEIKEWFLNTQPQIL